MSLDLLQYCHQAKEREDFVGIRFAYNESKGEHQPYITFPYGYEATSHSDILCLVSVLSTHQREQQESGVSALPEEEKQGFPIQSYMVVIQDYLSNGYYKEREVYHASRASGKISWGRTVKKEKAIVQDNGAVYVNFQTRLHHSNDEHILTEISKHCVYESLAKLGWFYGLSVPAKPTTSILRKPIFLAVLQDKLHKANKDMDKQLFQSMINVLNNADENDKNPQYFTFGTRRFEKVWEDLIEKTFGTEKGERKADYFPTARWHLIDKQGKDTNALLPDTIMKNTSNNTIYVIDAKYYRYGVTHNANHLPAMSSIAKQITYAEFVYKQEKIKFPNKNPNIRNVFILPCDASKLAINKLKKEIQHYHCIGWAVADWLEPKWNYRNVYTILLDTKYLMNSKSSFHFDKIRELSQVIENHVIDLSEI